MNATMLLSNPPVASSNAPIVSSNTRMFVNNTPIASSNVTMLLSNVAIFVNYTRMFISKMPLTVKHVARFLCAIQIVLRNTVFRDWIAERGDNLAISWLTDDREEENGELPKPAILTQNAIVLEAAIAELQGILQELGEDISL